MAEDAQEYPPGHEIEGTVYKVVRTIGAGGMGTVYDVVDTTVDKRYVLKTLHAHLCDRTDLAKRMQIEARTMARIHHPNIVDVVTAGITKDALRLPYYVMEKLNGQSLRYVLTKKGRLDLPYALHIAIDLLDALEHAHERGVIHRDVKPDNIFLHRVESHTCTKLLDFGIMRLVGAGSGMTGARFMGTPRYSAPEQIEGKEITPLADVYSAGLVLYEMITGRSPFEEIKDPVELGLAQLNTAPPTFLEVGILDVSPAVEKLVRAAISKSPERRPKDAFTLGSQLRNIKLALQRGGADLPASARSTNVNHISAVPDLARREPPVAIAPLPASLLDLSPPASAPDQRTPIVISPPTYASGTADTRAVVRGDSNTELAHTRASTPVAKGLPESTAVGMTPPSTAGGSAVHPPVSTFVPPSQLPPPTMASSVDRSAPTRTLPAELLPGTGPQGTQPFLAVNWTQPAGADPVSVATRSTVPMTAGITADPALQGVNDLLAAYPSGEGTTAASDAGQSRTLGAAAPDRNRGIALALLAFAAFGVIVTGGVAIALRHHASSVEPPPQATAAALPPTSPLVTSGPQPVLAPPALDDPSPPPPASVSASIPAPPVAPVASVAPATAAPAPPPESHAKSARGASPRPTPVAPPTPPAAPARKHGLPGSGL